MVRGQHRRWNGKSPSSKGILGQKEEGQERGRSRRQEEKEEVVLVLPGLLLPGYIAIRLPHETGKASLKQLAFFVAQS